MSKTLSTPTKPSRISVPISPDAAVVFQRLAKATGRSLGSVVAEWLDDTIDSAQFVAQEMENIRGSTKEVSARLHAYALGLADETGEAVRRAAAGGPRLRGGPDAAPPSCNTGGKVVGDEQGAMGGKSQFPLPPAKVQAYANNNGFPPKGSK